MKMLIYLVLVFLFSLTTTADIYTWNTGELLTTKTAEPYANLSFEFLEYAALSYTDLTGANLIGAELSHATLFHSNLNAAELSGAVMAGSYLNAADLSFATLFSADLTGVDFTGAFLLGTHFTGADLSHANLGGVASWDYSSFEYAYYNLETILPACFDPVAEGMILVPEPCTLLLLGMGGLLFRKRK